LGEPGNEAIVNIKHLNPGLPHDEQQENNGGEMQWEERKIAP